jgi:putative ABC transport system substrate-binding protein
VFIVSFDPVANGLAASLARPGGNATGMTGAGPETSAKRLQVLRELAPTTRRVGVIWNAAFPGLQDMRRAIDDAAPGFGLTILEGGVRDPEGFPRAFELLTRERVDALIVLGDNLTYLRRRDIIEAAARNGWPAIYTTREFCDDSGLVCYGVNLRAQYKRGAVFIDKILRGAGPAGIPVEQPQQYDLVINLKTAKMIGLTIPQSILLRAHELIE